MNLWSLSTFQAFLRESLVKSQFPNTYPQVTLPQLVLASPIAILVKKNSNPIK